LASAWFDNHHTSNFAIRKLKAEAILTYKTDGMDDEDVSWVSPPTPALDLVAEVAVDGKRRT
jgi:hypothetical protein